MTDWEKAATFGALAMAKVKAGEPTTREEDRCVVQAIFAKACRHAAAERAQQREMVAA